MRKQLMISEETHKKLKDYCVSRGLKLNEHADKIISDTIDILKGRKRQTIFGYENEEENNQ